MQFPAARRAVRKSLKLASPLTPRGGPSAAALAKNGSGGAPAPASPARSGQVLPGRRRNGPSAGYGRAHAGRERRRPPAAAARPAS